MLTNIEHYFCDGANYTIQAVMCLCKKIYLEYYEDYKQKCNIKDPCSPYNRPVIMVGRYENCREQGYILTLMSSQCGRQIAHYAIYEHRNSDNICVNKFRGSFINTPNADVVWSGRESKYDYDQAFSYNEVWEAYEWLEEDIKAELAEYCQNYVDGKEWRS